MFPLLFRPFLRFFLARICLPMMIIEDCVELIRRSNSGSFFFSVTYLCDICSFQISQILLQIVGFVYLVRANIYVVAEHLHTDVRVWLPLPSLSFLQTNIIKFFFLLSPRSQIMVYARAELSLPKKSISISYRAR